MEPERHDLAIRWEIIEVFELEARLANEALGVGVIDGVVTLTGIVGCGAQWIEAERLVRRVAGVRDVIMELQIIPAADSQVRDLHLAARARNVLDWFLPGEINSLQISVAAGWVTLSGTVFHYHVKEDATHLIRRLKGVTGLDNRLLVLGGVDPRQIEDSLKAALRRRTQVKEKALSVVAAPEGEITINGDLSPAETRVAAALARSSARDISRSAVCTQSV